MPLGDDGIYRTRAVLLEMPDWDYTDRCITCFSRDHYDHECPNTDKEPMWIERRKNIPHMKEKS